MACERDGPERVTAAMIEAGVIGLHGKCPCDVAFPAGGEDEAVAAVLVAAMAAKYLEDSGKTEQSFLDIIAPEQRHLLLL